MRCMIGTMTALVVLSPLAGPANAAVPALLTHHGQIQQAGAPVSGTVALTFRLYDGEAEAAPFWEESVSVTATGGYYAVILGQSSPLDPGDLAAAPGLWLGIRVAAEPELSPRLRVSAVPYALAAARALVAEELDCEACVPATSVAFGYAGSSGPAGPALDLACTSNCISTAELDNGVVTTPKLNDGAVTSAKIADGTIATADLADASVTLAKLAPCADGDLLRYSATGGWQCTTTARMVRQRLYWTSGTYTPTPDVAAILVGACGATGGKTGYGGIGGAGYAERYYSSLAASYAITIGAGGTGSSAGGATSFDTLSITSSGGVSSTGGSAGGVATGGTLNANGGSGGTAAYIPMTGDYNYGGSGGGGGRAGPGGNGGNADTSANGGGGGSGGNNASGTTSGVAATTLHANATTLSGASGGYLESTGYSFRAGTSGQGASGSEDIRGSYLGGSNLPGCRGGQYSGNGYSGTVTILEFLK